MDIEYLPADCWQVNWPIVASKFRNIYWSIVIILWMCWCLIMLSEIDMIYVFLLNVLWDAFSKLKIKKNNLNLFSFVCFFFNVLYTAWPIWTVKYSIKFFFSLDNGLILFKDLLESGVNEQKKRGGAWILQYKWRNNAVF